MRAPVMFRAALHDIESRRQRPDYIDGVREAVASSCIGLDMVDTYLYNLGESTKKKSL